MKIAIVGSRNITNYIILEEYLNEINLHITYIISGGAKGVDTLAEEYAKKYNIPTIIFKPNWEDLTADGAVIKLNKYGKKYNSRAGFNRNKDIIENSDAVVALWDGISKGTKDSMNLAIKLKKPLFTKILKG